jgi:hypothetical protein
MRLHVTFKQQNPDFDKEYAKQYHFGKESDGNWKYKLEDGYRGNEEVDKIAITEKNSLTLKVKDKENKDIELELKNMTILEGISGSKIIMQFAVSNKLIKNTHKAYNEKYNITRFYFYFNNRKDFVELTNGIYILKEDLPDILKR